MENERFKMEKIIRQSQEMEAIWTLGGGIAHDFNNILSSIIGYSELTLFDVSENLKTYNDITEVLKSASRAKELVQQILTFSRQTVNERMPIQIKPISEDVIKLLRFTLPSTIEIYSNIDNNIGNINGDSTQIHQIMMNLCTNAAHTMEENGGLLESNINQVWLDSMNAGIIKNTLQGQLY